MVAVRFFARSIRELIPTSHFQNDGATFKCKKYKYNSYFYCAAYSLADGALQKSVNTCFTAVGGLK